ncbi:uncharacterized protein LAESUDRAFT_727041 [Laetiporus sulphureus 93-53]|uniref:Uncharacterized protein n=1 Tax=Laetiporus sulphureus 93-53 TaxID=1314785 RepID=A0A165DQC6_9APHY|nr:uncharacterized protein LAESUDRAFT_727041 [Laetiporus sulphureus 93-53]KZT05393.1 hypothetical protein LAESUDRAFT_727041 [Laetiporus sulphureus 93-53]
MTTPKAIYSSQSRQKECSVEQAVDKVLEIVRLLHGPNYLREDIEWAASIPTGEQIIRWVASQVDDVFVNAQGHPQSFQLRLTASLEAIALYDEETQRPLHTVRSKAPGEDIEPNSSDKSLTSPRLRASTETMEAETELLQEETKLLQHRVRRAKLASKQLHNTISTLRTELQDTSKKLCQQEEHLGDISLQADTSIVNSVAHANKLLEDVGSSNVADDIFKLRDGLSSLTELRSNLVDSAKQRLAAVDEAYSLLPGPVEIPQEAETLQERLQDLLFNIAAQSERNSESPDLDVLAQSYCLELQRISENLEAAQDVEGRRAALRSVLSHADVDAVSDLDDENVAEIGVDVGNELERAWRLDQKALLLAREKCLDETIEAFGRDLLPPLQNLFEKLSECSENAFEAEALVRTLTEELKGILDDVDAATEADTTVKVWSDLSAGTILESELVELLKRKQNLRSQDAGPLVLLDRTDLEKELHEVSERLHAAEDAEIEWSSSLPSRLSELTGAHASLISTIYAYSPVNTSPPFSLPPSLQTLENEAAGEAKRLSASISRLQKDVELSDRDRKKLSTFIKRWR